MSRIKLQLPATFAFSAEIPVRITDINYGGHLGNDSVLSILHEARMQYLRSAGYSELDVDGVSLIMSDAAIEFRQEAFYGEVITAYVTASEFTRAGFTLYYRLTKKTESGEKLVALAKTGMVCFDYQKRKIVPVPPGVPGRLH
jgi:YbgC/YbaW family acyl-CoA thioester hydrolase